MIRKLLNGDIDRIADIWLKTNLKAHYFISNQYWKSNYELVKEMMSQYEVYVFEADKMIQGFVGLNDKYIEGIFVSDEMQSCGIGKLLLDYVKDKKVSLRLNVYQKNARAISFYQREGFIIQYEGLDVICSFTSLISSSVNLLRSSSYPKVPKYATFALVCNGVLRNTW